MGCGGSQKWLGEIERGSGSCLEKAIKNQALIEKYNQKLRVFPIQKCITTYYSRSVVIDHVNTRRKTWKQIGKQ
jgi:hypothetical protein